MTPVPAVGPEESVPVKCVRTGCGEILATALLQWRHHERHIEADRAVLRPSRRGSADKVERETPLRVAVGL